MYIYCFTYALFVHEPNNVFVDKSNRLVINEPGQCSLSSAMHLIGFVKKIRTKIKQW